MSDQNHTIVKLSSGHQPGYYVTRRPEPCDAPVRAEHGVTLLVEVDGPFGTYNQALSYVDEVTERSRAVDHAARA